LKHLLVLTFLAVLVLECGPKKLEPVDLNWTDFTDIQATFPRAPRPVFLYISQDNCEWCEHMDSLVFTRPEIAHYLNDYYMSVNINVDQDMPITVNNKPYHYQEFFRLLQIRALPAYYFFDSTGQILGIMDSAMPTLTFKRLLVYVENRHFMRTTWEEFLRLPEADIDTVYGVF
jgi:thioredoxin-related protein